jgi:hypothetical protein
MIWNGGCDGNDNDVLQRAYEAVNHERESSGQLGNTVLTYGEMDFDAFARTLIHHSLPLIKPSVVSSISCIPITPLTLSSVASISVEIESPNDSLHFVDLGSGAGRLCSSAWLLHNWRSVTGIEISNATHQMALNYWQRLIQHANNNHTILTPLLRTLLRIPSLSPSPSLSSSSVPSEARSSDRVGVHFENGSFLDIDWSYAHYIIANATCFGRHLVDQLALRAATCTYTNQQQCDDTKHSLSLLSNNKSSDSLSLSCSGHYGGIFFTSTNSLNQALYDWYMTHIYQV